MSAEDDEQAPAQPPESRRFSVGDALGGWARRVGELVSEVAGSPPIPDTLKPLLIEARKQRMRGDVAPAIERLRDAIKAHPDQPHARLALGLALLHDFVLGGRPLKELGDAISFLADGPLGREPVDLLRGAHALFSGEPEAALDHLRRASRGTGSIAKDDVPEVSFFVVLLAGLTQLARGEEDRALRELQKARARLPENLGPHLRTRLIREGVELLLAADELADAELWLLDALSTDQNDRMARDAMARVLAAKGDRIGAHAMLEKLEGDPTLDYTRLYVGLTVGLPPEEPDTLGELAMRLLQSAPQDPGTRRLWALASIAEKTGADGSLELEPAMHKDVLDALLVSAEAAPPGTRNRYLQEVAHVALRLENFDAAILEVVEKALAREDIAAPEELRLLRARHRIASNDVDMDEDFVAASPPRFRAEPGVGGIAGPDPLSPVRDPDRRDAVLASQRALASAELCIHRGDTDLAQDLLVDSLIEFPGQRRARRLLAELSSHGTAARLEDLLASATTLLAAVPNRVLGVSLADVQTAMHQVVAARERLARPLTIAIMGEFSAGKSTFVNALLAESVAPMGVLPTTSTINVFRRGSMGCARVHYRDGRISTLDSKDVQTFLHGLDPGDAATIRHVEIERTGSRMGDARVVDTPGLNALDAFHEEVAREFLDEADAVVWLFSATRSGAATEVGMLSSLRAGGRQVLGILNKVDTLDAAERTELVEYLREQLGEVLIDVVPLCARDALEFRTNEANGEDPFAAVEAALESHFLGRARELKRSLTVRRFGEALDAARAATQTAVEELESRAAQALNDAKGGKVDPHKVLAEFGATLAREVLDVDDLLTREMLSLGLQPSKGRRKEQLDPQDRQYLETCVRDGLMDALRRSLRDTTRVDPTAAEVLDRTFAPWVQGYIEGLLRAGFVETVLAEHGTKIGDGEAALRSGFRDALAPTAQSWAAHARLLARDVAKARARQARASSSAPQAEALRLRSTVVTAVDALRGALESVE